MKSIQMICRIALAISFGAALPLSAKKDKSSNDNDGGSTSGLQIGKAGVNEAAVYHFSSDLNLDQDIEVVGPVTIVVDGNLNANNHNITISSTGSLKLYVGENVNMSGKSGFNNMGRPQSLTLYGTKTDGTQELSVAGNGSFSGIVYAPNANLILNGGGSSGFFAGAAVVKYITLNGGYEFHMDESLFEQTVDVQNETMSGGVVLTRFAIKAPKSATVFVDGKEINTSDFIDAQF